MDCSSCGVVNQPGRRYCRACGARLGQPCPVCHFFNAVDDNHCGGCGRLLQAEIGPRDAAGAPTPAFAPAGVDNSDLVAMSNRLPRATAGDVDLGGQGVSQTEIDGLFENILDEEPGDPAEGDA